MSGSDGQLARETRRVARETADLRVTHPTIPVRPLSATYAVPPHYDENLSHVGAEPSGRCVQSRAAHAATSRPFGYSPIGTLRLPQPRTGARGSISLTVFPAVSSSSFGGRESVGEGYGECVESGLPAHGPAGPAGPGRIQRPVTRYRHFRAACSEGKWPRARTARR